MDRQGIIIRFGAAIADFLTGKNRVKDELKDVEGSLDNVKDASDDQAAATAGGLREVEKAAQDAESATSDLKDGVGDVEGATEDLGATGGGVLGKMRDGLLGLAGVAGGVAGIVQTVLGKAWDYVQGKVEAQQKAAAELEASLVSAYKNAAAEGRNYLTEAQIIAAALDAISDPTRRANAADEARRIGVDVTTYIRAQAGDQKALNYVIEQTNTALKEAATTGATLRDVLTLKDILTENEKLGQIHLDNAAAAEQYQQIVSEGSAAEREQIRKTSDASEARYAAEAARLAELAEKKVVVPVELDTSEADRAFAAWRRRFTTGDGVRVTIIADIVDRLGKPLP